MLSGTSRTAACCRAFFLGPIRQRTADALSVPVLGMDLLLKSAVDLFFGFIVENEFSAMLTAWYGKARKDDSYRLAIVQALALVWDGRPPNLLAPTKAEKVKRRTAGAHCATPSTREKKALDQADK
ncbi:MAG: hypothetical protein HY040_20630 [Planctomycetes bacterium]|nr:hypothetical protein [Planctomycetota bacterium]